MLIGLWLQLLCWSPKNQLHDALLAMWRGWPRSRRGATQQGYALCKGMCCMRRDTQHPRRPHAGHELRCSRTMHSCGDSYLAGYPCNPCFVPNCGGIGHKVMRITVLNAVVLTTVSSFVHTPYMSQQLTYALVSWNVDGAMPHFPFVILVILIAHMPKLSVSSFNEDSESIGTEILMHYLWMLSPTKSCRLGRRV